jgi:hypothetical protein
MSYISVMAVREGIVMLADRRGCYIDFMGGQAFGHPTETELKRKIFTIGSNIGLVYGGVAGTKDGRTVEQYLERFCKTHSFTNPEEAGFELIFYMKKNTELCDVSYKEDSYNDTVLYIAGYDNRKKKYILNSSRDTFPKPEIYFVTIKAGQIRFSGDMGFLYAGSYAYIKPFTDKLNTTIAIKQHSLQGAVDFSKLAFDITRGLEKHLDLKTTISDDFEMIAITPYGIQWLRKAELEILKTEKIKL